MFVLIEDNKNRAKYLHFQHLKHHQNKTAVSDSSFDMKVLFIFSSQAQCKISLKILLILHLADKRLYNNILQLHFNFKITLF